MVTTITEVLNIWNELGVFSYMIPFLLLFAIVFAILDKSEVLGDNKTILSIVAAAIGLLALQFDFVSEFFAIIFPRFGIGLAVFLVWVIMLGFFYPKDDNDGWSGKVAVVGWTVGIGVILWALSEWGAWRNYSGFGGWFSENIWAIIILAVLVVAIVLIAKPKDKVPVVGG